MERCVIQRLTYIHLITDGLDFCKVNTLFISAMYEESLLRRNIKKKETFIWLLQHRIAQTVHVVGF